MLYGPFIFILPVTYLIGAIYLSSQSQGKTGFGGNTVKIMAEQFYKQVVDGAGNVSFVPAETVGSSAAGLAARVAAAGSAYVSARAGEQSTLVGAVGGAALSPAIAQNAATAIAAGLAGDYVGAAAAGIPALIGIVGSLAAIFTPEKAKGLSDEQIKSTVASLTAEQLISLLANTAPAVSHEDGDDHAAAGVAKPGPEPGPIVIHNRIDGTDRDVSGIKKPLSTAIKTV